MPEDRRGGGARTVLAFDYGSKRLGVAVGQELGASARALTTLPVRHGKHDWTAIAALVEDWGPDLFVLGLPGTADGTAHALEPAIRRFARQLEGRYGREVALIDERLSSYAAASSPAASGRAGLDGASACVILQTWFNHNAPA